MAWTADIEQSSFNADGDTTVTWHYTDGQQVVRERTQVRGSPKPG